MYTHRTYFIFICVCVCVRVCSFPDIMVTFANQHRRYDILINDNVHILC